MALADSFKKETLFFEIVLGLQKNYILPYSVSPIIYISLLPKVRPLATYQE